MKQMTKILAICLASVCAQNFAEEKVNIIPTPKDIKLIKGTFPLNNKTLIVSGESVPKLTKVGISEINKKISEFNCKPLSIISDDTASDKNMNKQNLLVIGTPENNPVLKKYLSKENISLEELKPQGYIIKPIKDKGGTVYLLAGKDDRGVLHACISFLFLIKKNDDAQRIFARMVEIKDWPDFPQRVMKVAPFASSNRKARRPVEKAFPYLDWCLLHKINHSMIDLYRCTSGNYRIPDKKDIEWLKKYIDYANSKGILVDGHALYAVLGLIAEEKGKPEFEGCMEYNIAYSCWSRDKLIEKWADKVALFIRDTGFNGFLFHFRDGSPNENWNDRCSKCKKRFGDDRAAADANYINIMYRKIKEYSPETIITFVTEPYYGDLDIPQNKPYRDFFRSLSSLIPEDIYLVNTSFDKKSQDSWKKVVRQPILQWRNLLMDYYHSGRRFTTEPYLGIKTGYYPNSKDIPFINCKIGPGRLNEVIALETVEAEWNVPGNEIHVMRPDTKHAPVPYVENLYAYPLLIGNESANDWLWYKSYLEPKKFTGQLLYNICEDTYGKDAAGIMMEILKMGIANKVVLMQEAFYMEPEKYQSLFRNPEIMRTQYEKAEKAIDMLENFKTEGKGFKPAPDGTSHLPQVLKELNISKFGACTHYHLLLAEKNIKERSFNEAKNNLKKAKNTLSGAKKRFSRKTYNRMFSKLVSAVDSLNFRLALISQSAGKTEKTIKVGIYNPNGSGGMVYGEQPIYNTLMQCDNIRPFFISSLKNLFQYDCLIIPDCKKFATADQGSSIKVEKEVHNAEMALRNYVIREGKGIMFYHDSVGYVRFPLQRSVFPEISTETEKRVNNKIKPVVEHELSKNLPEKLFKHMYWDHIIMKKGEKGTVVFADSQNNPVVIVGTLGDGKVVMNGTIIFNDKTIPKEAKGIDKTLLLNSIDWLTGGKRRLATSREAEGEK